MLTLHESLINAVPQLISALAGGGIAFGASAATNRSNNKRLSAQYSFEREQRQSAERMKKGEELYVLIHSWMSTAAGHYLSMGMAMQGKLTVNQVLDADIERGQKFGDRYEASRIELYVRAYFPTCCDTQEQLMKTLMKLNRIDADYKHAYDDGDFDGTRFLPEYVRLQTEFERQVKSLQGELITQLRTT